MLINLAEYFDRNHKSGFPWVESGCQGLHQDFKDEKYPGGANSHLVEAGEDRFHFQKIQMIGKQTRASPNLEFGYSFYPVLI